jgi:Spy/CpxP family protein refolding chaperone
MVIRTVTVAMILATVTGVASTTQAAHANKGGIPDAHAGTHPFKSCINHSTQNKCTRSQIAV